MTYLTHIPKDKLMERKAASLLYRDEHVKLIATLKIDLAERVLGRARDAAQREIDDIDAELARRKEESHD